MWLGFPAIKPCEFSLLVTISKDGMDQSKWALPRNRVLQTSKEASVLIRPRLKVHGLWIHGVSLNLYVVHPGVVADSTLICECFSRALQDAFEIFESAQMSIPKECLVWAPRQQISSCLHAL